MNLLKRTATALVLLPLAFVSIQYFSRLGFLLIIQILILASLIEFYQLPRRKQIFPAAGLGVIFALLITAAFYFEALPLDLVLYTGLLFIALYYLISVDRIEKLMRFPAEIALTLFGAFYLSFSLNHFTPLRDTYGPFYIYFMLSVIWVGDTGAFIVGRKWGRRKMTPMASPNKTWEGSAAGLVTAILTGIAAQQILFGTELSIGRAILYSGLIHIVAQISDPVESLFKRAAGVKDSSNLLPGHGGFLDRLDSLIFATPFFFYLLRFLH